MKKVNLYFVFQSNIRAGAKIVKNKTINKMLRAGGVQVL